jgi:hypothetical protein
MDEVCAVVTAATPAWVSLAASADAQIRRSAVVLLALALRPDAADALRERASAEPDPLIRAEALAGLGLHPGIGPSRDLLSRRIAALAADPLGGICAAISWLRTGAEPAEPAVDVILAVLRGTVDPAGVWSLRLSQGNPGTALKWLTAERMGPRLGQLCTALDEVSADNAFTLARALLDIVFPERQAEGEPLTGPQRQVIAAIAASDTIWANDANARRITQEKNLADERHALRALAGHIPPGRPAPA